MSLPEFSAEDLQMTKKVICNILGLISRQSISVDGLVFILYSDCFYGAYLMESGGTNNMLGLIAEGLNSLQAEGALEFVFEKDIKEMTVNVKFRLKQS